MEVVRAIAVGIYSRFIHLKKGHTSAVNLTRKIDCNNKCKIYYMEDDGEGIANQ